MTNINNVLKKNMQDITMNNQGLIMQDNQSKIEFLKNLKSLRMCLNGVDKNRDGYGYKYQDFNEIIRTIKQVIKDNNLDIDFIQCPTIKSFDGNLVDVITTTFYSTKTGYEYSFDTRMCVEEIKALEIRSKMTLPQLVGTNITYFKRYALVAYLSIESEVDNDASALEIPKQEDRDAKEQAISVDNLPQKVISENGRSSISTIPNNTIAVNKISKVNKVNSVKFNGYKSMLIAARSMHNYIKSKPFDSIKQINSYLSDIEIGNDVKLLKHFSQRKELQSIRYWITLIRDYIIGNNTLKGKLEQFNAFVAFKEHLYQSSPIKLFAFLSGEDELKCLFKDYEVNRVAS